MELPISADFDRQPIGCHDESFHHYRPFISSHQARPLYPIVPRPKRRTGRMFTSCVI